MLGLLHEEFYLVVVYIIPETAGRNVECGIFRDLSFVLIGPHRGMHSFGSNRSLLNLLHNLQTYTASALSGLFGAGDHWCIRLPETKIKIWPGVYNMMPILPPFVLIHRSSGRRYSFNLMSQSRSTSIIRSSLIQMFLHTQSPFVNKTF